MIPALLALLALLQSPMCPTGGAVVAACVTHNIVEGHPGYCFDTNDGARWMTLHDFQNGVLTWSVRNPQLSVNSVAQLAQGSVLTQQTFTVPATRATGLLPTPLAPSTEIVAWCGGFRSYLPLFAN